MHPTIQQFLPFPAISATFTCCCYGVAGAGAHPPGRSTTPAAPAAASTAPLLSPYCPTAVPVLLPYSTVPKLSRTWKKHTHCRPCCCHCCVSPLRCSSPCTSPCPCGFVCTAYASLGSKARCASLSIRQGTFSCLISTTCRRPGSQT